MQWTFFLQDHGTHLVDHYKFGNFGHRRRLSDNTRNYYRVFGYRVVGSVSFFLGSLDARLSFVNDGSYVLTGNDISQDIPSIWFKNGSNVYSRCRCEKLFARATGGYAKWVR
jgi:hypothetical protein